MILIKPAERTKEKLSLAKRSADTPTFFSPPGDLT